MGPKNALICTFLHFWLNCKQYRKTNQNSNAKNAYGNAMQTHTKFQTIKLLTNVAFLSSFGPFLSFVPIEFKAKQKWFVCLLYLLEKSHDHNIIKEGETNWLIPFICTPWNTPYSHDMCFLFFPLQRGKSPNQILVMSNIR